jgi:hypothetical protein
MAQLKVLYHNPETSFKQVLFYFRLTSLLLRLIPSR